MSPELSPPDRDPPSTKGGRPDWLSACASALQALLDPIVALAFIIAISEVILSARAAHSEFWLNPGALLALALVGLLLRQALELCARGPRRPRRHWRASY